MTIGIEPCCGHSPPSSPQALAPPPSQDFTTAARIVPATWGNTGRASGRGGCWPAGSGGEACEPSETTGPAEDRKSAQDTNARAGFHMTFLLTAVAHGSL